MRAILVLLLCVCALCHEYTKLEKLSHNEIFEALKLIDNLGAGGTVATENVFLNKIEALTGEKYDGELRNKLYAVLNKNINNTSYYAKIVGLFSFQNVLLVCLVIVVIAFIFSLLSDLLFIFGAYIFLFVYKIFLSKEALYTEGTILSIITLYFKYDQVENWFLRYLFIFDRMTPLFGCIIFYIVFLCMYMDYIAQMPIYRRRRSNGNGNNTKMVDTPVSLITILVWAAAAMYHNNWMVGTISVMMFFNTFGFRIWSTVMGYNVGFKDESNIFRCVIISICLNGLMLMARTGFMTGNVVAYMSVFETGIYFWATFVGSIGMLILTDEYYMQFTGSYSFGQLIFRQLLMAVYCIVLMFFGNVLYITSYNAIGGTFLVLWLLDVERMVLSKFKTGGWTIMLLIIAINLYGLKQLISWYPDYFIF